MKRFLVLFLLCLFLCGCKNTSELDQILAFRQRILSSETCSFTAEITADYLDVVYHFTIGCEFNRAGDMTFTVLSPDSIKGITGTISDQQGALTFDDQVLLFELLADEQLTPISAPWLVMKALRSGYIQGCGTEGDMTKAVLDDTYQACNIQTDIWFTNETIPVAADILWQNRRILSIRIVSFSYM